MNKTTASDLKNPQLIDTLLEFRKAYKRHWPSALNALANQWKVKAGDLNQLLSEYQTVKKEKEKKESKKKSILNAYPKGSQMNFNWEEDEEGELKKIPKLTKEMWEDLAPVFKDKAGNQWPVNIRGQLLLWDEQANRPDFLKPDNQTLKFFSILYARQQTVFWEENRSHGFMPRAEFVSGLVCTLKRHDGFSEYPHFPPLPGFYYKNQIAPGSKKTGKLEELVNMFNPATPADKDKIRALFCNMFWGGPAGERPMFIVTAKAIHGQASGKTTLIQAASKLVEGSTEGYIKFNIESGSLDGEKLKTRVLGANGQRIIFFDNVRSSILGSGYLEDTITSDTISGHRLHFGLDSIKNHFTVCATLNDSMFSKDIVTRAMVIQILPYTVKDSQRAIWKDKLDTLLTKHKKDIITDIKLIIESEPKNLKDPNRFPRWCRDVMSKCTDDLEIIIKNNELAKEYNAETEESDKIHEDILGEISRYRIQTMITNKGYMNLDWDEFPKLYIRISESMFLQWICKSLGFRASQTKLAKKKIAQLNMPWLKKDKEGLPHISKAMGAKLYTYGNPQYPEPNKKLIPKIINNDTFLGEEKNVRMWMDTEAEKPHPQHPHPADEIPNPFIIPDNTQKKTTPKHSSIQ